MRHDKARLPEKTCLRNGVIWAQSMESVMIIQRRASERICRHVGSARYPESAMIHHSERLKTPQWTTRTNWNVWNQDRSTLRRYRLLIESIQLRHPGKTN